MNKLTPKELEKLKELIPDFTIELQPKHQKQVDHIHRIHAPDGQATKTKKFYKSRYAFLIDLDNLRESGYKLDAKGTNFYPQGGINAVLQLSEQMIKESLENALRQAKNDYEFAVSTSNQAWIDGELEELIKANETEKMKEIKIEEQKLKTALLSKLFQ